MSEQIDFLDKLSDDTKVPTPDNNEPEPREPISDEFEVIEPPAINNAPKNKDKAPKPYKYKPYEKDPEKTQPWYKNIDRF